MSWLEFISSILKSITWPIIVLIAVLALRKPVSQLILKLAELKLKTVKYGDWEFNFAEELKKAESQIEITQVEVGKSENQSHHQDISVFTESEIQDFVFEERAKEAPYLAIYDSWSRLEEELKETMKRIGIPPELTAVDTNEHLIKNTPKSHIKFLLNHDFLDVGHYESFLDLQRLRNAAVHEPISRDNITYNEAERYHRLTRKLIKELRNINPK
ncbi:hypothetical protein HPX95_20285 [Bacillus tequilensis]|uniref:hypothetical protein n=1 Tax=Bacillus tequilensis TaxID=227866 RepID=UPI0015753901|nr:hypothetical protein [Bacillus tequilensis]NTU28470.1 hypothetical protein [Bacillus tequilensis]